MGVSQLAPPLAAEVEWERTTVLGIPVVRSNASAVLDFVRARLAGHGPPATLFFANAHSVNLTCQIPVFRAAVCAATLVLNDGVGMAIAGWLKRRPFPENLNGSDLSPALLEVAASEGVPVYFLGAKPGVAQLAAETLRETIPGLVVAGVRDGYFTSLEASEVAAEVRASGAGMLLVGMGNPRQELWIAEYMEATGVQVAAAVGAFFDYASNTIPRARHWMNHLGVEWIWRLVHEPRRLARRYLLGNPLFLLRVATAPLRRRRVDG
jgi:exopolysaccharide biosynthesis WecB/TagA/CpsF family protein